jgi:hypothetical protein
MLWPDFWMDTQRELAHGQSDERSNAITAKHAIFSTILAHRRFFTNILLTLIGFI